MSQRTHLTLPDGAAVVVRPLEPADRADLEAAVARLSDTTRYLRFAGGEPSRNLLKIVPEALRYELRAALMAARQRGLTSESSYVRVPLDGEAAVLLIEPLTEREREVLVHVSGMLNTAEVAEEMYISVNTVKTHLRNIYRKLSAAHRSEAVRRARQLQLI